MHKVGEAALEQGVHWLMQPQRTWQRSAFTVMQTLPETVGSFYAALSCCF
jgi:hypothetical protein